MRRLEVDLKNGLASDEVKRRQAKFGFNRITARPGTPSWVKFLQQLHAPLVYILLAAVGVTAFLREWVDSSVIFGVVSRCLTDIRSTSSSVGNQQCYEQHSRSFSRSTNERRRP